MKKSFYQFVITMAFFCFLFKFMHIESKTSESIKKSIRKFHKHHNDLSQYTHEEVILLANQWQEKLANSLKVTESYRKMDMQGLERLLHYFQEGNATIFMRHGEQKMTPRIQKLNNPSLQKIEMMRKPDNHKNPVTEKSLVEFMGTAILLSYLEQITGSSIEIETAYNKRSSQIAELLGEILHRKPTYRPYLNCIDYPSKEIISTQLLIRELSKGIVPWEKESIDFIIGENTYNTITQNVKEELQKKSCKNKIRLKITHTQQISAALMHFDFPQERFQPFGFVISNSEDQEIFFDGLFGK